MKYLRPHVTILLAVMVIVSLGFGSDQKSQNLSVTSITPGQRGVMGPRNLLDVDADNAGQVVYTGIAPKGNVNDPSSSPAPLMPVNKSVKQAFATGLTGTYSIPGDFASISAAVAVLNFVGLSGDVTFELVNASYSELSPVTIGNYPGAGTYTATFQPAAATAVTVNFQPSATEGKGFAFNGATGVTIDGLNTGGASLTLQYAGGTFPTSDPFAATVYITGASSEITIANTTVKGQANNVVWASQTDGRPAIFVWAANSDPSENYEITIDGCTLINATYGLKVLTEGDWTSVGKLTATNNNIGGAYGNPVVVGMFVEIAYQSVITGNTFDGVRHLYTYYLPAGATLVKSYTEYDDDAVFAPGARGASFLHGIGQVTNAHLLYMDVATIANNVMKNHTSDAPAPPNALIGYGSRMAYFGSLGFGTGIDVYNNRISVSLTNITNVTGIRGDARRSDHNSVRLFGAAPAGTTNLTCYNQGTFIYNNAFSNEMTGATATVTVGMTNSGTINNNAIYSTGRYISGFASINAAVAAGVNTNGAFGPVSFDSDLHITAGSTSAKQIGKSHVRLANDVDGTPRDTTDAGVRDAGADEFSPLGSFLAADALPSGILSPPAGVPTGVPVTPTVRVKNNSQTATGSFNVSLTSTDGYSDTKSVSLAGGAVANVNFATWTPVGAGPRTFTATTLLGGDATPANDVVTLVVTASAPVVPPATYTFDASAEGWTGAIDWVRSNTFTKLGGVNGGAGFSWVTQRPTNAASYTEGAYASSQGYATTYPGANILMSPWLDISGIAGTDLYISFQHSIETEPLWDRSWLQYTVDGITWTDLGVLNDPNGINWYDAASGLYEHAAMDPDNFDEATMGIYGLAIPPASWTSNDDGTTGAPGSQLPVGPSGYVYVQLHVTETSHAALVGSPTVRFRYIAFSDAVGAFGGWAFDNFSLGATAPIFTGGTIDGHAWTDANGNGVDDGEADISGADVIVSLFGSPVDTLQTNGTGDYSFTNVTLPAAYDVHIVVPGVAFTVPYGTSGTGTVNHPSTGGTLIQNFGTFIGGVSGVKFSDVNDNGANDSEPNLSGWTIEAHKDSANGTLIGSDVSDGSGYSILLPPGTFVIKEVAQPLVARQTAPGGAGTHTIVVNNITPLHTAKDFGNFVLGRLRVTLNVDANGNGVKDGADVIAVPSGAFSSFLIEKNAVPLDTVVLGNGTIAAQFTGLDVGTYTVTELDSIAGWRRTKGGVHTFTLDQSNESDTAVYLDFKYLVITGTKFNDLNGDGVKDLGEPGLAGWTINVSGGTYYGATSAVTDGSGDYSIDSVFTGTHTVSETGQAGWTNTLPIGGTYSIPAVSGNLINTTGKNFGNFDNTAISGLVYRDYNGNGTKDAEDVVMTGVSIDLASGANDVTDGSGYSFDGVYTNDTVRITVPGGYVVTQPAAGEYALALLSGGSAVNQNFGLFQSSDSSTKYRTFTADQLSADDQKKPGAKPKPGKAYDPVKNKPSTGNLVDALINPKTGFFPNAIVVGLPGQLNLGGKTKAYVVPNKQGAFWASLNNKGNKHDGMARGFDVDVKGKPFLKLQKAFAPGKKQDNKLFGELLALKLNLLASGVSTPAGLGVLIYSDPASDFDGWTIDEIADYADTVMTNFEFMPLGIYSALDSIAGKINGAFYNSATDDTANGWASPVLTWKSYTSVFEVPFLKPNPGATPKNRHTAPVEVSAVPTEFALSQNYPNPFNPTTTIEFEVPQTSLVTLKVYNLLGQEVAILLNREEVEFSETVEFDASTLPSGVYLYRIEAETIADADAGIASETFTKVQKMVLVK